MNQTSHLPRISELPAEDLDALKAYAAAHGRRWKHQLKALWLSGRDDGALRRLRNRLGPAGLDRLQLSDLSATR